MGMVEIKATNQAVSIPLESGHIVMIEIPERAVEDVVGFNPLRIGSYCNLPK